jgi:hypothetical protein
MGMLRILVSPELIQNVMHMPIDVRIINVSMSEKHYRTIEFLLEGKELPQGPMGAEIPVTTPVITHQFEEYLWDWNIPNKE